jgi:Domain of unknown function (DUF4440)
MKNKTVAFFPVPAVFLTPLLIVFLAIGWLLVPASMVSGQSKPIASSSNASPGVPHGTLEETLIALEKKSWEAWKNRDGNFFDEFLSDDHLEVGFGGLANKAAVVNMVGSPVCAVKSYTVDKFKCTQIDTNVAILNYYAAQDTVCYGKPVPSPVWVTSLFVKRGERWVNVLYQHSEAMPSKPN